MDYETVKSESVSILVLMEVKRENSPLRYSMYR